MYLEKEVIYHENIAARMIKRSSKLVRRKDKVVVPDIPDEAYDIYNHARRFAAIEATKDTNWDFHF